MPADGGERHALSPRLGVRFTHAGGAALPDGERLPVGAPIEAFEAFDPVERPRYLVEGRDVTLVGQRALVDEAAAGLVNDVSLLPAPYFDAAKPLSTFPHEFRMTNGATREGEALRLDARAPRIEIAAPVVALSSTEARNYGSWLFRIVPKLVMLDEMPEAEGRALLLPQETPWMRELTAAFAPGRPIVAQDVMGLHRLADVVMPSLAAPQNAVPADVRRRLRAHAERVRGAFDGDPTRLYVSRRAWSAATPRRVMRNEDGLVERLAARGFIEIAPERLSLDARIDAFARADRIVGPSGSGLFNVLFARPGAVVVEIEPVPRWRVMHAALYRSLGLKHAFVPGRPDEEGAAPDHPDWSADLERTDKALAAIDRIA